MLTREIKFKTFKGEEVTRQYMFHLSKADCFKLNFSKKGGLMAYVKDMLAAENIHELVEVFDQIIDLSYGYISGDDMRFVKDPEYTKAFKETDAYSELFMELFTKDGAFSEFMMGVIPQMTEEEIAAAKQEASKMLPFVGA